MTVTYTWAAKEWPGLSFGKAGEYIRRELAHICTLVPRDKAAEADLQLYLGLPLWGHRRLYRRLNNRFLWFTMWEHPQVPRGQIGRLNASDGVISPCRWVDAQYAKRGVTAPRFVVPLGYDPAVYKPVDRLKRDTFTFLWLGMSPGHLCQLVERRQTTIGDRKRGWLVREAFRQLDLPNSQLILKGIPFPIACDVTSRTPRGRMIRDLLCWMSEAELQSLYAEADVFVWPTWGEGWGMPPLEAAATGLPCILPNYSGIADYFDPAWCLDLPYTVGRIWPNRSYHGARIALEDLKRQMLWAYEHREALREMGDEGARRVRARWTWEQATRPALRFVLRAYERKAAA